MNCYYSNLIEGHNTHPIEIQRALFGQGAPIQRPAIFSRRQLPISRCSAGLMRAELSKVRRRRQRILGEIHFTGFMESLPGSLKWVQNSETGETGPVKFPAKRVKIRGSRRAFHVVADRC